MHLYLSGAIKLNFYLKETRVYILLITYHDSSYSSNDEQMIENLIV